MCRQTNRQMASWYPVAICYSTDSMVSTQLRAEFRLGPALCVTPGILPISHKLVTRSRTVHEEPCSANQLESRTMVLRSKVVHDGRPPARYTDRYAVNAPTYCSSNVLVFTENVGHSYQWGRCTLSRCGGVLARFQQQRFNVSPCG
jgi:hypothetical protein